MRGGGASCRVTYPNLPIFARNNMRHCASAAFVSAMSDRITGRSDAPSSAFASLPNISHAHEHGVRRSGAKRNHLRVSSKPRSEAERVRNSDHLIREIYLHQKLGPAFDSSRCLVGALAGCRAQLKMPKGDDAAPAELRKHIEQDPGIESWM